MTPSNLNLDVFAPELGLTGAVLVTLLAAAFGRHRLASGLGGMLVAVALVSWWRLDPTAWAFGGDYGGDGVSYFARGFFLAVAAAMTVLVSNGDAVARRHAGEFVALIYMSVLGMMVMASAQNWIVIFLGLEIMSVPLYILAAFHRHERASVEAGVKYFVYGAFASAFFVYGIALLYNSAGTLHQLLLLESVPLDALATAGMLLIFVGLAFKIAAVPFHMWAPDAYEGAPTIVTSFFAVAPKAAGFVALYRLVTLGYLQAGEAAISLIATLAVLTILAGNLWALAQNRLKRMLAYSSIAHAGYLLLAIMITTRGGVPALLYYLVAYGMMTLGAFVVLLAFERDGAAATYDDISGGARRTPVLAMAMTVFMMSLAGFPMTAGFIGKLQIFRGLIEAGHVTLVIVAVAGTLISVGYYLRVIVYLYMRSGLDIPRAVTPRAWGPVAVILAVCVIYFGLFPDTLWTTLEAWSRLHGGTAVVSIP